MCILHRKAFLPSFLPSEWETFRSATITPSNNDNNPDVPTASEIRDIIHHSTTGMWMDGV